MHFITGKHLPRRTFLKAAGATVALPFLESMVPAGAFRVQAAAPDRTRLVCIEEVHGLAGCNNWGATKFLYAPETTGADFKLVADNPLSTIEAYRDYMTIVSNTDCRNAEAMTLPEIGGDHFRSSAVFLTQSHPKKTQGSDVYAGTSLDQLYAQKNGQDTPIPSMQLSIETVDQSGGCAYGYSCAYTDSISWATPEQPLPMIRDPRAVFDALFGVGATPAERAQSRRADKSILDWVSGEVSRLSKDLGASDRQRLNQYLTEIREIERRIQKIEAQNSSGEVRELPDAPVGVPDDFAEHVKLMFDLQVLAFASDVTRVFSFKLGRDGSARVYPESGVRGAFHPASHHGEREERVTDFMKINRYHVSMVPYFLKKLKETPDGDGQNLLDNTLVIYGSPMGNSNVHNHKRCPLFLAGKAGGALKGNLHLKAADGTPMANVFLSVMQDIGIPDLKQFGDSTGRLELKSVPSTTAAV